MTNLTPVPLPLTRMGPVGSCGLKVFGARPRGEGEGDINALGLLFFFKKIFIYLFGCAGS